MTQQAQQQTTAIQRREPLPFIPANMEDAWRTSELLARASIIPEALRGKPHDVLVAVLTGAELGISPMQALREVYVVKGRPFIASLLRVALIRQSPECLAWQLIESTPKRATFRTQRRGDLAPTTMSFTIEEAEAMGLVAQNPRYRTDPALQLRRRCAGRLIDEVYPDIIRGVGAREDVEEEPEVQATGPATVRQLRHVPSTSAPPSPVPEVVDAREVTPPPGPPPEEQAEAPATEPTVEPDVAMQADAMIAELPDCTSQREVDAISRRAKDLPHGPERDAVGAAITARRAELRGAR